MRVKSSTGPYSPYQVDENEWVVCTVDGQSIAIFDESGRDTGSKHEAVTLALAANKGIMSEIDQPPAYVSHAGHAGIKYGPEITEVICGHLASGMSLTSVCLMDGLPHKRQVVRWLQKYPEFVTAYVVAVKSRAHIFAEEMIDIADNQELDPYARRIMIDTRKWIAGKHNSKYAEASTLRHEGSIAISRRAEDMTDDELATIASRGTIATGSRARIADKA